METVPKVPHLHRRPGSNQYQFRLTIPKDLREFFGKTAHTQSLRTSDYKQAASLCKELSHKWDRLFSDARKRVSTSTAPSSDSFTQTTETAYLTDDQLAKLREHILHDWLSLDDELRIQSFDKAYYEQHREVLHLIKETLSKSLAMGTFTITSIPSREVFESLGIPYIAEEGKKALELKLTTSVLEAIDSVIKRHEGVPVHTPAKPKKLSKPKLRISQALDKYVEQDLEEERTKTQTRAKVQCLIDFIGDKPLKDVTKEDAVAFKDALTQLPDVARLPESVRKLDFKGKLRFSKQNPTVKKLGSKTINNNYLGTIRTLFNWGLRNNECDLNPFNMVGTKESKRNGKRRTPYSLEELNLIFQSDIITGKYEPTERVRRGEKGNNEFRWLPLLALYTGARLEELGMLRHSNVKQHNDIYYFDIEELEEGQAVKTSSSRRKIPVHKKLIELGFLEYLESVKDHEQIFPHLPPNKRGKHTAKFSTWWNRWCRGKLGITDERKVFHSFRHNFKDAARNCGVESEARHRLQGHAARTEGEDYGAGFSIERLAEEINKVDYPGLFIPSFVN